MERCRQSVNVIKLSHLFTISPPLSRPPSNRGPLSLLLSGPLYHSFKVIVALKPLANVSMSLFRAGQWPASLLPPGCSLIDGPPLGEWQAALVRLRWPVWQLGLLLVTPCVGPRWVLDPQEPPATGLAHFAWAQWARLPGVLVVADQLVSCCDVGDMNVNLWEV